MENILNKGKGNLGTPSNGLLSTRIFWNVLIVLFLLSLIPFLWYLSRLMVVKDNDYDEKMNIYPSGVIGSRNSRTGKANNGKQMEVAEVGEIPKIDPDDKEIWYPTVLRGNVPVEKSSHDHGSKASLKNKSIVAMKAAAGGLFGKKGSQTSQSACKDAATLRQLSSVFISSLQSALSENINIDSEKIDDDKFRNSLSKMEESFREMFRIAKGYTEADCAKYTPRAKRIGSVNRKPDGIQKIFGHYNLGHVKPSDNNETKEKRK